MGWIRRLLGLGERDRGASPPIDEHRTATVPRSTAGSFAPVGRGAVAVDPRGFAVVDVETTGLSPRADRVVAIAVVLVDARGQIQHEWATLVNPQGPVGATHIHGIRDADVANAPTFGTLVPHVTQLLTGRVLVAHNARFDESFLRHEYGRAGWGWPSVPKLCTLEESHYFLPHLERRRLADCCWATQLPLNDAHSALGDARAAAALLGHFLGGRTGRPTLDTHRVVVGSASRTVWPTGPGIGRVAAVDIPPPPLSARARAVIRSKPMRPTALLESFSLADALDEGAPAGSLSYVETLVEFLEDGQITASEHAALADVAELYELTPDGVAAARRGLVRALAREAVEDGVVSRAEKSELTAIAVMLGVEDGDTKKLLSGEEESRLRELSAGLAPLPIEWGQGEPFRVGHRIVFTGCEAHGRDDLEARATRVGMRVGTSVTRRTVALVSDGTVQGRKAEAAELHGVRVIEPAVFEVLLRHVQPWEGTGSLARPAGAPGPALSEASAQVAAAATTSMTTAEVASGTASVVPPSVVRAWAIRQGHDVGARGRLSSEIWDAYRLTHGRP